MHLLSVSPLQLLDLWDKLASAKAGESTYNYDVTEVYISCVMPHSALFAANPASLLSDDVVYAACCNIHAICRLFEQKHKVIIEFEGGENIDLLLDKKDLFRHRIHLRVRHGAA